MYLSICVFGVGEGRGGYIKLRPVLVWEVDFKGRARTVSVQ